MNNNLKKLLVAGLACAAVCTTALAAPHVGKNTPAPRTTDAHHETHAPKHDHHHTAPALATHHHEHHAHARPAPPPPAPARTVVVHEHHEGVLATALGALVGGLLGAAL